MFNWYEAAEIVLKSFLRRTLIDGITHNGVLPVLAFCARAFIEPPSQNNATFQIIWVPTNSHILLNWKFCEPLLQGRASPERPFFCHQRRSSIASSLIPR